MQDQGSGSITCSGHIYQIPHCKCSPGSIWHILQGSRSSDSWRRCICTLHLQELTKVQELPVAQRVAGVHSKPKQLLESEGRLVTGALELGGTVLSRCLKSPTNVNSHLTRPCSQPTLCLLSLLFLFVMDWICPPKKIHIILQEPQKKTLLGNNVIS